MMSTFICIRNAGFDSTLNPMPNLTNSKPAEWNIELSLQKSKICRKYDQNKSFQQIFFFFLKKKKKMEINLTSFFYG